MAKVKDNKIKTLSTKSVGAPIEWTDDKKKKAMDIIIFQMVENGKSINTILKNADRNILPSKMTFFNWLREDKELSYHYATAYEARADILFDEILEIADDTSNDTIYGENGEKVNSEWINRSRLKVDARKWILAKMNPKKFGDKTDITTNGKEIPNTPIVPSVISVVIEGSPKYIKD